MRDEMEKDEGRINRSYARCFNNESGETVMQDLAVFCGMFEANYDADINRIVFREAMRSVYLYIYNRLQNDAEELPQTTVIEKEQVNG